MKFYYTEGLNKDVYYHASDKKFDYFKPNYEGVHISDTYQGAIEVARDRLRGTDDIYVYTVTYNGTLKPLELSGDIQCYSASAIAELLLNKINGDDIWASTHQSKRLRRGGAEASWIPADEFTIGNDEFINSIKDERLAYLYDIYRNAGDVYLDDKDYDDKMVKYFMDLCGWIFDNFGYNCITYPLGESSKGATGILIFNADKLKIEDIEEIKDFWSK